MPSNVSASAVVGTTFLFLLPGL